MAIQPLRPYIKVAEKKEKKLTWETTMGANGRSLKGLYAPSCALLRANGKQGFPCAKKSFVFFEQL